MEIVFMIICSYNVVQQYKFQNNSQLINWTNKPFRKYVNHVSNLLDDAKIRVNWQSYHSMTLDSKPYHMFVNLYWSTGRIQIFA